MSRKRLLTLLLCGALGLWFPRSVNAEAARSKHHDLKVVLHPSERKLSGFDAVTVNPLNASTLTFLLSQTATVHSVTVSGKSRAFAFKNGELLIPVESSDRKSPLLLQINYSASFDDSVPDTVVNTDNPGYGVTGIISERGTFLQAGAGWYPEIPESRPTFHLFVEAPAGTLVVSSGRCLGHETKGASTLSEWEAAFPSEGLSLSAGRYVVQEKKTGGVTIATYFFPESASLSQDYLNGAARYIGMYEELIGPYPFQQFSIVENFFPTGYGFPSYTLLGSTVIRLPFIIETSLGHEIAHCWWGNGVLVDYRKGNWCEGLTTYLSDYLYKERSSKEAGRDYRLQILRDFTTLVNPGNDFPLVQFQSRYDPASQAIGYGKGAMVFHMLRRSIGDRAFWDGLKDVFRDKLFKEASWKDFQIAFERRAGVSLQSFFDQWIFRRGAPLLSLDSVAMEPLGGLFKVRAFILQKEPVYDLDLDVVLESESLRGHTKVSLSDPATLLEVPSSGRPLRLLVDPDFHVFRALYPSEIPPTVNSIKGSDSLTIVLSKAWQAEGAKVGKTLALSLGVKNYTIIPEERLRENDGRSQDLLFIGFPEKDQIPMNPLPGLILEAGKFILQARTFETPSDVFFGVFHRAESKDRVVALFLPLSSGDIEDVARKITHYGKYSYLAFKEGKNEMKGTWPITESRLTYSWN